VSALKTKLTEDIKINKKNISRIKKVIIEVLAKRLPRISKEIDMTNNNKTMGIKIVLQATKV